MPTMHEKEAFKSRMETFLEISAMEERVARTALAEEGEVGFVSRRTRNVADDVKGAETF